MQLGQNLSDSEHSEKTKTRSITFDPFAGRGPDFNSDTSFLKSARDLVTNTAFNFADSVLFNAPSSYLNSNIDNSKSSFYGRRTSSYGNVFDSLGIKPFSELSGAGKFGYGIGQAAGFFVPYGGVAKLAKIPQRALFSNVNRLMGTAVDEGLTGLVSGSAMKKALSGNLKGSLKGRYNNIGSIIKSADPRASETLQANLYNNVRKGIADFFQENGQVVAARRIDESASRISSNIIKAGQGKKSKDGYTLSTGYVDNLEDLISHAGIRVGDNRITRNLAGFVGRSVDQSINFYLYDNLAKYSRYKAGDGTEADGSEIDFDQFEMAKDSLFFSSVVQLADFIPGGRKAGMVDDMKRFLLSSIGKSKKDRFQSLLKNGKVNEKQLRSMATYFSGMKGSPRGFTNADLKANRMTAKELAKWLDDTYSANKKKLFSAIMKDTGKGFISSLPRAAVDGAATMLYMNGEENFINPLEDESMLADFLVGGFMAMRAYSPIDPRGKNLMGGDGLRWRYNTSIDAKFNLMENMGISTDAIQSNVKAMDTLMRAIDFESKTYSNDEKSLKLYDIIYGEKHSEYNESAQASDNYLKEKGIVDSLAKTLIAIKLDEKRKSGEEFSSQDAQDMYIKGEMPNVYAMSDEDFSAMWSKLSNVEIKEGKTVASYKNKGFDFLIEDLNDNIVKNHEDVLLRSMKDFLQSTGIMQGDNLQEENGKITIQNYSYNRDEISDEALFFLNRIKELENTGRIQIQNTGDTVDITSKLNSAESKKEVQRVAEKFSEESATFANSAFNYSMMDNPVNDFFQAHSYLKAKNRIVDALYNNGRPGDTNYEDLRSRVNQIIGESVGRNGIEIVGKDDKDFKEGERDSDAEELVRKLAELKQTAGMSNANTDKVKVSIDDARGLLTFMETNGYAQFDSDNGSLFVSGKEYDSFRQDLRDEIITSSNLDTRDYVVYSVMAQTFGRNENGQVIMPTPELAKSILEEQLIQENSDPDDIVFSGNTDEIDSLLRTYSEVVKRLGRSGRVEFVDSMLLDTNRDGESKTSLKEKINLVKKIYDDGLASEIFTISKSAKTIKEKLNNLANTLERLKTQMENELKEGPITEERENYYLRESEKALEQVKGLKKQEKEIGMFSVEEDILTPLENIIKEQDNPDTRKNILARLFDNDIISKSRDYADFSFEVAKLANLESVKGTFTAANLRLRQDIIAKMEEYGVPVKSTDVEEKSLKEVFEQFAALKESGELPDGESPTSILKNITRSVNESLNTMRSTRDAQYNSELNAVDILDMFNKNPIAHVKANAQTFSKALRDLGLTNHVDVRTGRLTDSLIEGLTSNDKIAEKVKEIDNDLKEKLGDEYESKKEDLHKGLVATVQSLGVRQHQQKSISISANTFVYDDTKKGVKTPLDSFVEEMNTQNYNIMTVKDTYVDSDGNKQSLSSADDPQSVVDKVLTIALSQETRSNRFSDAKSIEELRNNKDNPELSNAIFVTLQASEDVGILFARTENNVERLKRDFSEFKKKMLNEAPTDAHKAMLKDHFDAIEQDLKVREIVGDKKVEAATSESIGAAMRAMYYRNHISKDVFWRMIGEDSASSRKEQAKVFKYIHHVNSKNAVGYSFDVLKRVEETVNNLDSFDSAEHSIVKKELNRRASQGIRIMVLEDEIKGPDGKIMKNLSAAQIMEDTIKKIIKEKRLNYSQREIDQIIEDATYDLDRKIESTEQGLFDGVTFARKEAMTMDAFMMGESFEAGTTAMKAQFHSTNTDASLIGKTAVRHTKSMQKFMEDAEIDYLIPASSAKSWDNKGSISSFNKNYDTSKTLGWNLSKNVKTDSVNFDSKRTFSPDTLKYMYPAHNRNHKGNRNSSVTHHMTAEAIEDYNKQLAIDNLSNQFARQSQLEHMSGVIGLFKNLYDDNTSEFSALSAAEQLYQFGLTVQDSLIRDTIFRAAKDVYMNDLIARKTDKVQNNFLFSNSRLKSPTYGQTRTNPHVRSFGEIRLQHQARNVTLTDNLTLAFSHSTGGKDYQDVTFNAKEGKLKLTSYDRSSSREDDLKTLEKDLKTVWKAIRNSDGTGGTFGTGYDLLNLLNSNQYTGIDKSVKEAIENLNRKGINDFSIVVNPHKIPKKFASDSVINRVEGFLDKEEGNVTEVNNYEIATNHQADQDGDKITTYLDMPYSVIVSSAKNMEIVREPLVVPPKESAFPNVFNSMTSDGEFRNSSNKNNVTNNNPAKYLSDEKKSKFIVGSTVKLQGVTTLMNIAGVNHAGSPIMKFGNEEGANKDEIRDFQRQIGSITQSILDAWKGVHTNLLDVEKIKNYILFGDPIEGIDNLKGQNAFKGIFKIPSHIKSTEREVYKDFIRETVKSFEEAYSSLGDVYEGGVRNKPEFFHFKRIHRNLNSLMENDSTFVYNRLLMRYKNTGNSTKISALKSSIFTKKNPDESISVRPIISFDKSFNSVAEKHPQVSALKNLVEKVGDIMNANDYDKAGTEDSNLNFNHIQKSVFGFSDERITSSRGDEHLYDENIRINQAYVDETIFSRYNEIKSNKKDAKYLIETARRMGVLNEAIESKISSLESQAKYYAKINDKDMVKDINATISHLRSKQFDFKKTAMSAFRNNKSTFVATKNNLKYGSNVKNNTDQKQYYYKISSDGNPEFSFVIPRNSERKILDSGNYVVLYNPIEIRRVKERQWKEGFAQEYATITLLRDLQEITGTDSNTNDMIIKRVRSEIEQTKHRLRENMSYTMETMSSYQVFKSDLYSNKSDTTELEMQYLFSRLRNVIKDFTGEDVDGDKSQQIAGFIVKSMLQPRLLPGTIMEDGNRYANQYKIDKQFSKSVIQFLTGNRLDYNMEFDQLGAIMRQRSRKLRSMDGFALEGAYADSYSTTSERLRREPQDRDNKGMDLFRSMAKLASKNPILNTYFLNGDRNTSANGVDGKLITSNSKNSTCKS